jgi:hypothetical protein
LPIPLLPERMEMNEELLVAVQAQALGENTATVPEPPG